jgi:putative phosphoribosyl transferase
MRVPIPDRETAGEALAGELSAWRDRDDVIVLALPRGGVPVAYEIASRLNARLDVLIVRKLGVPVHRELAMGAIASGGIRVMNEDVVRSYRVTPEQIESVAAAESGELERRAKVYRGDKPWPKLAHHCVILVDDGVATGATMFAAIDAVRAQHAAQVVVAIPVAPADTVSRLKDSADKVVCLAMPEPFYAIGQWYQRFNQVNDDEVIELIGRAWDSLDHRQITG